jgi:N-formylglutamate amidohydrolase
MFFMSHDKNIFDIYSPKIRPIGLISIPHSGQEIPSVFQDYLTQDERALKEDVDYAVPELIDIQKLVDLGITVMVAKIHRACIDLNRPPETACLNWKENTQGIRLVIKEPSKQTNADLVAIWHTPYIAALTSHIEMAMKSCSKPISVIDLHSMPSKTTAYHLKLNPNQKGLRPDFCISDQLGKSCKPDYINFILKTLREKGFNALANDPYQGGFITKFLTPMPLNNVQIEINRSLYMNEQKRVLITPRAHALKASLTEALIETFKNFS